jgi:hypothetical protein
MKIMMPSLMIGLGLLAVAPSPATAQPGQQYDQNYARPRDLAALQNDLVVLDDALAAVPPRNRRSREFQQRAGVIRQNVSVLAEQMREHRDGRREGRFGNRAEIEGLRRDIAVLRDDIENTQTRRRANNAGYVVPAGTEIQIMLDQDVSSRSSNARDRITASTVNAIRMDGRTVIPAGATVSGYVTEVRSKHRGQNDGWLKLEFDTITPEGGQAIAIRSQVVSVQESYEKNNRVKSGGIGALLGGVVGALIDGKKGALIGAAVGAGGGLLASRGTDDVDLPEGSLMTLRLDNAMNYARR